MQGIPPRTFDSAYVVLHDTLAAGRVQAFQADADHPMRVMVSFLATDTSMRHDRQRDVPVAECPFVLTLVPEGDTRAVWRSDRAAARVACPRIERYETLDRNVTWEAAAILGDSLPNGRYQAELDVRLADGRVLRYHDGPFYLDKRREPPSTDYSVLRYSAATVIEDSAPRRLTTSVVATNSGSRILKVDYGACALNTRLFRNRGRAGPPAWRSENRRAPGFKISYVCTMQLIETYVAPGDSLVFRSSVPMYEVIGDSLPSGHYHVSAELGLEPAGRYDRYPGQIRTTLAAGEVDIAPRKERLPAARTIDGLTFAASTRVVSDTIHTTVRVTNATGQSVSNTIAPECSVAVYGYATEALRDSVPIVNTPISLGPACRPSRREFTLAPGQSWTFELNTPVSMMRARFGPGHYWFTAWPQTKTYLLLAAGDVEVR